MSSNLPQAKAAAQMPITEATKSNVTTKPNPITQILKAAAKADNAIAEAKAMPDKTDDGFIKNLFQTIQGVKHDALCPHGLPYYACMSCSH
jgi:hypothetical protein